jgi:hypothetical protein
MIAWILSPLNDEQLSAPILAAQDEGDRRLSRAFQFDF